jgi:hypothetical protein
MLVCMYMYLQHLRALRRHASSAELHDIALKPVYLYMCVYVRMYMYTCIYSIDRPPEAGVFVRVYVWICMSNTGSTYV